MRTPSKSSGPRFPVRRRLLHAAVSWITLASYATSLFVPGVAWAQSLERPPHQPFEATVSQVDSEKLLDNDRTGGDLAAPIERIAPEDPAAADPQRISDVIARDQARDSPGPLPANPISGGARGAELAPQFDVDPIAQPSTPPSEPRDLPTGADKSGVTSQAISTPKGSGKIDGMGESFSAQLSTGIATFSVPLAIPAARGGAQASLGLSYSSSSGAGVAGMGWSVAVPFIARETDRGLPQYDDHSSWHAEQDRFVFNGGQELVPICTVRPGPSCAGALPGESMPPWSEGHQYFRPRVEGSFLRFFWSPDHKTWRVQDKSGVTMELGVPLDGSGDASALEVNPDEPSEIYKWHLVRQYDTYGVANPSTPAALPEPVNVVVYKYTQDGGMAYLSHVFHTTPDSARTTKDTSLFAHHVRFSYEPRTDPTFSYRTGWRVAQSLRLKRVDVASKPFNGNQGSARRMVRRYHLAYDADQHRSLLATVQVEGRCGSSSDPNALAPEDQTIAESAGGLPETTSCPRLPAMTFGYSHVAPFGTDGSPGFATLSGYEGFDERLRDIASSPPHSVDEALSDLFDINSDALPDVLVTAPGLYSGDHAVFFNGAAGRVDAFGDVEPMTIQGVLGATSTTIKLSNLNIAALDLNGDATIDLLHMPALKTYAMYTPRRVEGQWTWVGQAVATASGQNAKIDFGKDTLETKVVDVNFDGLVDVVVSTGLEFQTFYSLGRYPAGDGQFGQATSTGPDAASISNDPVRRCVPWSGAPVRFSDGDIQLAEINGDGIPDIVRVRRGDIRYWPGRGNGVWGTGRRDDCPANSFMNDREIAMATSPQYSDIQGTSLRVDDVNGDGLDDLVQVRYDAVDVWLNVDGAGWTKRHIIAGTPHSPSFANRVRLVDVNGSGTRDILWGNSGKYRYIDLQGGSLPHVLTRIENGLGKSTDIEYSTSTAEMLSAEAHGGTCDGVAKPWSSPWCSKMPIVAHVVKRVTESDNLTVAGRPPASYVTEYTYRDPVYDGRQREFRGFRKARSKRIGDENSPTDFTESTFLLGECKDETPGDGVDDCSEPWLDNPREALKGLPILSERYDERGVYLSSGATTYRLRQLYTGLDGRAVRHAFGSATRSYVYDTALGPAVASPDVDTFSAVDLEPACSQFDPDMDDPLVIPEGVDVNDETATVLVRQPAGRAEIASSSVVDCFGNRVVAVAHGCVEGSACPTAQTTGMAPDETIFSFTEPILVGTSGWLWRTERSYVYGSVHTERRSETRTTYTAEGDPEDTFAMLGGTLPLDRSEPLSFVVSGSEEGEIAVSSRTYSALGTLTEESGANGRCRGVGYDPVYRALPTSETIHRDGTCEDPGALVTAAAYDRGLGLITTVVDMQFQSTSIAYDGFGRLSELRSPRVGPLPDPAPETLPPSLKVEYFLPSPQNPVKYSVIRALSQDGAASEDEQNHQSYAYIDGLGRTLVTLAEAEPEPGGSEGSRWIAGDLHGYDAKSALCRKHLAFFYRGAPLAFPLTAVPETPYGIQRYDAFGRQLQTYDVDGTVTLQSVYHALSTDLFDAADLEPGPHQGTPATTRQDGHGRAIETTERLHVNGGSIEERHVRTQYLATGQPEIITRVREATGDTVVRWMRYDTLGRMVLNVEPNTTDNFDDEPTTAPTPGDPDALKAWQYIYNDVGDLVGTSDARGCGQNFFYDGAGRLIAEDYAPCEMSHHAQYSEPNGDMTDVTTIAGVEVLYVYDEVPAGLFPTFARPSGYAPSSAFLRGRLAAVFSRGSTTWTTYDARGRVVRSDVRVSQPNTVAGFTERYAPTWYRKDFAYDAADREIAATTGSTRPDLQGTAVTGYGFPETHNKSVVQTRYTARGTVEKVDGSYDVLVGSIGRTADGLVNEVVYGDAASTTTSFSYDNRRRLRNVLTSRAPPELWNSPPSEYQPAPDLEEATSFQLILQDEDFKYDSVSNPVEIRDWRDPQEWPDGAKPSTRKIQYDDLNRVKRVDYEYPGVDDTWTSPFASELEGSNDDPRRAQPSPHVSFERRIQWQTFDYDWLGNTSKTDDDAKGFYDRSLGVVTNDVAGGTPYQLKRATNDVSGGERTGELGTLYDFAGNLTRLDVRRDGPCLGGVCSQRFDYRWDEVGRLVRARRWDVAGLSVNPSAALPDDADVDADLRYVYDESDQRVVKSTGDGVSHTVYVFDSLELRRAAFVGNDYASTKGSGTGLTETEVPYLFANGMRLARVVFEREADGEPRLDGSSRLHVFFELGDHLGSTSSVLDQATGELVERSSHQAYGAAESDYRPDRWEGFREDYRFTGKEEDVEVGLQYFGKRFLSPNLGRWVSADPLAVHAPTRADLNLYAYVRGAALKATDPLGLEEAPPTQQDAWDNFQIALMNARMNTAPLDLVRQQTRWTTVEPESTSALGKTSFVEEGRLLKFQIKQSTTTQMARMSVDPNERFFALGPGGRSAFNAFGHEMAHGLLNLTRPKSWWEEATKSVASVRLVGGGTGRDFEELKGLVHEMSAYYLSDVLTATYNARRQILYYYGRGELYARPARGGLTNYERIGAEYEKALKAAATSTDGFVTRNGDRIQAVDPIPSALREDLNQDIFPEGHGRLMSFPDLAADTTGDWRVNEPPKSKK